MDAIETLRQRTLSAKKPENPAQAISRALADAPEMLALVQGLVLAARHPDWATAYCTTQKLSWEQASTHPIEAMLLAMSEAPQHEDALDRALSNSAQSAAALLALARSMTPWEHRCFKKALEHDDTRLATCAILAMADPERLEQWLFQGNREEREFLDGIQALLLFDPETDPGELLTETLDALRQDPDVGSHQHTLARLEALLAAHDPMLFARGALDGAHELSWSEHHEWVADVLAIHGETSWIETLAALELSGAKQAFGFAALLALCASASSSELDLNESPELVERHVELLDLLRAQQTWEPQTAALHFEFPLSVADEELTPLLVEVAIHERLIDANLPSPGVVGLPLSATLEESLQIEEALTMLREFVAQTERPDEETLCVTVRTLCDLRKHLAEETVSVTARRDEFLEVVSSLTDHHQRAAALVAQRILAQTDPLGAALAPAPEDARGAFIAGVDSQGALEQLATLASGATAASLWAAHELSELPLDESLPPLSSAHARCAIARSLFLRQLLEDMIEEDEFIF